MMPLPSAARINGRTRRLAIVAVWSLLAGLAAVCALLAFLVSVGHSGEATREVLFGVGHSLRWFLYASTALLFIIIALGPLRRSELWRVGRPEPRWDRLR